jgi:phosphatidylinositol glycan class B
MYSLNSHWRSEVHHITYAALCFIIAAAWFSVGYHHPDEHFQILEWFSYKTGNSPASDLAWEFEAKIRPALPVFIVYGFAKLFQLFGVSDPFTSIFLLRLITGVAAWYAIKKFYERFILHDESQGEKLLIAGLLFLTWFVPYLAVRYSYENVSSILLLLSLTFFADKIKTKDAKMPGAIFAAGVLAGLAFFFRFHIAFAFLGLGAWLLYHRTLFFKEWIALTAGGILAVISCLYLDYLWYEEWVITPVRYFTSNIVENKAAQWGVSPWWFYFEQFVLQAFPPVSLILLAGFLAAVRYNYKNPVIWMLIPFLLVHFIVGHKEMRFVFPVSSLFLYVSSIGIYRLKALFSSWKIAESLFTISIVVNIFLLFIRTSLPANELILYQKYLNQQAENQTVEIISIKKPVFSSAGLKMHFYKSGNVSETTLQNPELLNIYIQKSTTDAIFLVKPFNQMLPEAKGYIAEPVYSFLPDFMYRFNFNQWMERSNILVVYRITKT